jgi:hypothetical protein
MRRELYLPISSSTHSALKCDGGECHHTSSYVSIRRVPSYLIVYSRNAQVWRRRCGEKIRGDKGTLTRRLTVRVCVRKKNIRTHSSESSRAVILLHNNNNNNNNEDISPVILSPKRNSHTLLAPERLTPICHAWSQEEPNT